MDDVIYRKDAVNELREYITEPSISDDESEIIGYNDGIELAISVLSTMPSAQQWIPCSERLPEKFGDYLVSVKRHGWNCEEHIENDIAYWDDLEGFHKAEEVLAWMSLPEPYKGENAND